MTKKPPRSRIRCASATGGKPKLPARTRPAAKVPDASAILASVGEAAYAWDIGSDTLQWEGNAAAVLGLRDAAGIATGKDFAALLDPSNAETRSSVVLHSPDSDPGDGVRYRALYCLRGAPRSSKTWLEDNGRWFAGPNGRPATAHGIFRILAGYHERAQQSADLSALDVLTGESNRRHLIEQLEAALQESIRLRASCGFMIIAINNLARINDGYGYDVADEVICDVGKRLRGKMRGEDMVGRVSGNKFGVILKNCTSEDLAVAAERFLAGVRDDVIMTAVGPVSVTVTIGGVPAPRHAGNVQEILARAQEALDRAKARRPGSFVAYQPNLERDAVRRENMKVADKIVTALNERRIILAYEPVVHTQSREPAFYECLMRIRRSDGTIVPANSIVPIAERLGMVRLLDQRVLELAIAELVGTPHLQLSLNVSPASTTDAEWWARLGSLLRADRNAAERLVIEITETVAIHDLDDARGFVARVKDLGARLAIDDFGAGYTSFRNLRKLGVDIIKIDGEFVKNLVKSQDDRTFVRTMLDLGRGIDLKTVAEWVQDEQSAAMLAGWGCDSLQGDLIGRAATGRPWLQERGGIASALG